MLRSLSEQSFDFTMHYNGHRESTYVMVNRSNTLPNTYLEIAGYVIFHMAEVAVPQTLCLCSRLAVERWPTC